MLRIKSVIKCRYMSKLSFFIIAGLLTCIEAWGQQKVENYLVTDGKVKYYKANKYYKRISFSHEDNSFAVLRIDSLQDISNKKIRINLSGNGYPPNAKFYIATQAVKKKGVCFTRNEEIFLYKQDSAKNAYFELPYSKNIHILLKPVDKNPSVVSIAIINKPVLAASN
jgi:hypothetical protein